MRIQVHPFLVSRNRTLDYRTVVAPKFMCEAGNANLLASAAGGSLTPSGYAIYREIQGHQFENLVLVFRVVESNQQEIYPNASSEAFTDTFGREIYWIEGWLIQRNIDQHNLTQKIFEEVHKKILVEFRLFWENTSLFDAPIFPLESIDCHVSSDIDRRVILRKIEPFIIVDNEWAFLREW